MTSAPEALEKRWVALGAQDWAMPLDIFGLSRDIVDCPDRDASRALLNRGYELYTGRFQSRVYFVALRFLEGDFEGLDAVFPRISEGLQSENLWIVCDAVDAYRGAAARDADLDATLDRLAAQYPERPDAKANDAAASLGKRLAQIRAMRNDG